MEARAGSRRRHRRRAPVALGLTAAGSARGWGRGGPAPRRAPPPPPPHAVPRPGRLCPMRSGVAGRWGVFLFWVEVEAEKREELATSSRRHYSGRRRRRPCWSREVSPPRRRPHPAGPLPRLGTGTPGPARGPQSCTPQRPAPAAPAGPMRRDVNGVTKSRFEVCAWGGGGGGRVLGSREEDYLRSHAPENSLRTESPLSPGAVTHWPLGLPHFSPVSRHPKAQCSPASLVLPAGRLLRLPLAGPDGD